VLELGSHLGAFLQASEEWNWRAVGLDVGADTSRFVKSKGLPVHRSIVEDCPFRDGSFDAIFVWNCFEQIQNPATTLVAIHRALKRHGMLLIRVPNAVFYRALRSQLKTAEEDGFVLQALAYNNLLGFPYLYGYTAVLLNRLITECGFEYLRGFNSELVTTPFPDRSERISREQNAISTAVGRWTFATTLEAGEFTGPWVEMLYRKVEEDAWKARRQRGPAQVVPLPRNKIDPRFLKRAA
jgi:SAM-dependent methyltransferase